jgi:CubicO group peptidase (beta-lactamase class C family)
MNDRAKETSMTTDAVREQQLGEQVAAAMEKYAVPGVALGIVQGDDERMAGFGVTNIEQPLPVDADTLFQIGSTTKTVTGTLALRLVDEGTLDLDAPIRTYLPDLRLQDDDVAARVTMRHLLTHTGGWVGDYFDDTGRGEDAVTRIVDRVAELPQLTPLGEVWSYNNAGFYLAGRVLEVLTGRPYETLAQEWVFAPLGMDRSFFFAEVMITYRVAAGHEEPHGEGATRPTVARPWAVPRAAAPAGGIVSTVRDQLRYARFHLGAGTAPDGTRLLTPESMALMQTSQVAANNDQQMGITWFLRDVEGTRIVAHGGATNGQESAFLLIPSRRFAMTVLTNSSRGSDLNRDVTRWALEHYLGLHDRDPEPLAATADELMAYTGHYSAAAADVDLTVQGTDLIVQLTPKGGFPTPDSPAEPAPPPVRAALAGPDAILVLDEPLQGLRGEFLRGPDGQIAWLRAGGRVMRRER